MIWRRVTLTLAGPFGTPWQADTVFGHLCWALRHARGEAALTEFLEAYRQGKPPILLSSGFARDLLPKPLTLKHPRAADPSKEAEAFQKGRDLRKQDLITYPDFLRALQGEPFEPTEVKNPVTTRVASKNQVSRAIGATGGEGQLFSFVEHRLPEVTIYLKVADGCEELAKELFDHLAESGYGKRKSVGYGAIREVEFDEFPGFPSPPDTNGFVTLSPFVPAATDPTHGLWRTRVKYGKLGEEWAFSTNPFKRPVLMLTEGSVFRDSPVREWYGRLVTGVSDLHPEVVHYGYALPVPMRLPPEEG